MSASVIASVTGSSITNRVPVPFSVSRRSVPESSSTAACTTLMPTPRPLARSDSSLVENPGAQISDNNVAASVAPGGTASPTARARSTTASGSIPPPSSATSMQTMSPAVAAESTIVPSGRFPALMRSSTVSMPWLTAFRTRCSTGSIIRSMRNLSISVVCPRSSMRTRLPVSRARSRTTNGIRRKISPTGTSRTRMMPSRSVRSCRSITNRVFLNRPPLPGRNVRFDPRERIRQARAPNHEIADIAHQLVEPREIDADELRRGGGARGGRLGLAGVRRFRRSGRRRRTPERARLRFRPHARRRSSPRRGSPASRKSNAIDPSPVTRGTASSNFPGARQPLANGVDAYPARDQIRRRREGAGPARHHHSCGADAASPEAAVASLARPFPRRQGARSDRRHRCTRGNVPPDRRTATTCSSSWVPSNSASMPSVRQDVALPQRAQELFEPMREVLRLAQLDHARDALERVEVTEQFVEHGTIDVRATDRRLQRKQQAAHAGEVLVALGEIVVQKIGKRRVVVRGAGLGHFATPRRRSSTVERSV